MSVQCWAAASQKFTSPVVRFVKFDFTVAVSVTTVPLVTEVASLFPAVTFSAVVVGEAAYAGKTERLTASAKTKTMWSIRRILRNTPFILAGFPVCCGWLVLEGPAH